jgi:anaerobic magnesium-protoporphyrin IX monomethyl ester cyclase
MGKRVTLVYPYFQPSNDYSIFRFPPLGLGYLASFLQRHRIEVDLVDCTFLKEREALDRVRRYNPDMIGIYSMYSMKDKSLEMAKLLRQDCELLVTGGPLPTTDPIEFLNYFDIVAIGEGEETILEIVKQSEDHGDLSRVKGIAYKKKGKPIFTPPRGFIKDLDTIPFPAREFFDNRAYKRYYSGKFGYTTTSVMTSRGCPFKCDFCSRPVFGNGFRTRSAKNIVDEVEEVVKLGYGRIWFADDCFTLQRNRLLRICDEIIGRGVRVQWECLSRVDTVDKEVTEKMKRAGCVRVFFGIESGNDKVLKLMRKQITADKARQAVIATRNSGIEVGAFFIVGYPGEDSNTIHDTISFASALPLDYLSFTMPYPIPGTPLYERVKNRIISKDWQEPKRLSLVKHKLVFRSAVSEGKLKFAILKGMAQFELRKHLGERLYRFVGPPLEHMTDYVYNLMH